MLRTLTRQAEIQASRYPNSLSAYNERNADINRRYGSGRDMRPAEAYERLLSVMNLLHSIGSFTLRERYPYPKEQEPDDWTFTAFNYDVSKVEDNPVIKIFRNFYYEELQKEFQDSPDIRRRKEADVRAKRAYVFYEKYREYKKSGFDPNRIEEIFGITRVEQNILKRWLSDLMHDGQLTVVFASAGTGKTNTGAVVVQIILIMYPLWDIPTNIPFIFAPKILNDVEHPEYREIMDYRIDRVKFVENMSQMLVASAESVVAKRIPAPVLDEMDTARISIQSRSKESVSFKTYEYVERHIDTQGPLLIYHYQMDIPKELRLGGLSHALFGVFWYFNRINHKSRRVISNPMYWQSMPRGMRYFPVPLTLLPYHGHGFSPFSIDLDMQWLNQQLGVSTKKQAAQKILDLIPKRGWEENTKWEKKGKKGSNDKSESKNNGNDESI